MLFKWDLNLQMYNQLYGFTEKTLIQQQFCGQKGYCQKSEVADGWGMEKAICYHNNTWNVGLQQQKSLFSCEQETEVTIKVNNRRLGKWSDKCWFLELGLKGWNVAHWASYTSWAFLCSQFSSMQFILLPEEKWVTSQIQIILKLLCFFFCWFVFSMTASLLYSNEWGEVEHLWDVVEREKR